MPNPGVSRQLPSQPPLVAAEDAKLSRGQIVALALASFVPAVGIASFPALLVGSAGYGSWLAAMISMLAGFSIGSIVIKFAKRYVATGSLYSYVAEVFGPWSRYLVGASLFLGYLATMMCNVVLFAMFSVSYLHSIGFVAAGSSWMMISLITIAAVIPAVIAYRGINTSVKVAVTLAVLSVPLMLVITGASVADTGLQLVSQLSLEGSSLTGVFTGLAGGAAWLVSFESAAAMAAETKDPRKNVPAAVMAWPVALGTTYLLVTFLQIPGLMTISDQIAAGVSAPAALALNAGLGPQFAQITDLVLAVAVFAAIIGFTNYGSRFTKTLAQDGLLPRPMARLHPKWNSPHVSILANVGISYVALMLMMLVNSDAIFELYAAVATLVVYFWVIPYLLITLGGIRLMLREKQLSFFFVLACIVGAGTMLWLYINGFVNPPPGPSGMMTYVALIAVLVLGFAFAVAGRRHDAHSEPGSSVHPPEQDPVASNRD